MVSLCIACVSYTIAVSGVFKPVREYASGFHPKIDELIHCPYCVSHYVAFIMWIIIGIDVFTIMYLVDVFASIALSSLCHYVMLRAYEPLSKLAAQRKIERLKNGNTDKSQ